MVKKNVCCLIGIVLMVTGIVLFIIVVPMVKAADLGLKEYIWAIVVICSTCMGFGLIMMCLIKDVKDEKPNAKS